jgi:hypothetical protein
MPTNETPPAHTPAPFGAFESPAGQLYIAQLGARGAQRKHLCLLTRDGSPGENAANARLFATAPDLLGHLKRVVAMARAVAASWESCDLAGAVCDLQHAATAAETRPAPTRPGRRTKSATRSGGITGSLISDEE